MNFLKSNFTILLISLLTFSTASFATDVIAENSIKLILLEEIRSGRSKVGAKVNFKVEENILDSSGMTFIRKGTQAYGTVLRSRKAGAWGRRGILEVEVNYTSDIHGNRVNLRANETKAGSGNKRLITTGAWLVAWPLAFLRGSNVVIKAGSPLIAWLDNDTEVTKSVEKVLPTQTPKKRRFLRQRKY